MKKIMIPVLVCVFHGINAQTIVYDYANTSVPISNPGLKNGNIARFKIDNINNYAQKVVIEGKVFALNTDMPEEFKTLFRIQAEAAQTNLDETKKQVDKMTEVAQKTSDAVTDSKEKAASNEMSTLIIECNKYNKAADKIKDALKLYKNLEETLMDKQINTKSLMISTLLTKGIDATSINALKTDFSKFEALYENVFLQYQKAAKAAKDAQNEVNEAKIDNAKEAIKKEYEKLEEQYEKTLNDIDNRFMIANSPNTYSVISDPTPLKNADEIEFDVKIAKTVAEMSSAKLFNPSFNVAGGTKIDYSVGPVFNTLTDDVYYLDSKKMLQKNKNKNAFTPGLSAMMHITRRNVGNTSFGGMFGVNANFKEVTDVNLGFLGGVSVILGRERKVFVSTGVSYFKVSRLKEEQFKTGVVYTDTELPSVSEKVLKPSYFVSVSLSIAKRSQIK